MKFTIVLLLTLLSGFGFSQKLTYDIFLFGSKIGQSVVEKTVNNDSITEYTLVSSSEAHVFFTHRKVTLYYDIVYKRGKYFSSFAKHTRNDEIHTTTITRHGNGYEVKLDSKTVELNATVDCSTVKLFFAEPCNPTSVFSERIAEFRTIKKTGDGVYEAEMTDGLTYYYRYKSGKLVELEMRKGFIGSIYLRPH
jgi:hypothetical protein